jgi:glycosyltransferase involved in cell wall biosynthesis
MDAKNLYCLVMIVRDEAPVIQRCLKSVSNIATSYLICDTGSTDNTIELIKEFMASKNIPGEVITHEWKNFGYNKSYLLERAQADNMCRDAKYLFWLDADEVYVTDPNNYTSYPTKEDAVKLYEFMEQQSDSIFHLKTHFGGLRYWRWNLIRNDRTYRWLSPVHEYLVSEPGTGTVYIDFMCLLARKEGNSARDPARYDKDAMMFEEYLKEKGVENCAREVFYLAQTYESSSRSDGPALVKKYYDLRITMLNGYYQERYISALRMARRSENQEKLTYLFTAIEICPHRLEAYYELIKYYEKSNMDLAFRYGLMGLDYRVPVADDLFAEGEIYDWKYDLDFSLVACYSNHHKEAYEAGKSLLERKTYPPHLETLLKNNQNFYEQRYVPPVPLPLVNILPLANALSLANALPLEEPMNSVNINGSISWEINTRRNIIVIDNFFKDPDAVRNFALSQEYPVQGNYPGKRTKSFATEDMKKLFTQITGKTIRYWPDGYNGSFQFTTKDMSSWIHRDLTDYGALIYLTPNAPLNSGTTFYQHKTLHLDECPDQQLSDKLYEDSRNYDAWDIVDQVANKYNRMIIFNGRRSHSSTEYFGDDMHTGRLFQVFFFDVNP